MKLRDWRIEQGKTLRQLADDLGIGDGANPSRRVQRMETGEVPVDAILTARIVALTDGQVSLEDLHGARLDWLNNKRAA